MSTKGYDQGNMLTMAQVLEMIGPMASPPPDHKNEWMQNRFSLYPAGRLLVGKKTHLLWRERDVLKAVAMLKDGSPKSLDSRGIPVYSLDMGKAAAKPSPEAEKAAMAAATPGWIRGHGTGANPSAMLEAAAVLARLALTGLSKAGVA